MPAKRARITSGAGKAKKRSISLEPDIQAEAEKYTGNGERFKDLTHMINYLLGVYTGKIKPTSEVFAMAVQVVGPVPAGARE